MTADRQQRDELHDLLWSMEEGTISAAGIARIDELVCDNTDLLCVYIEHLRLFSDLRLGPTNHRVTDTLNRVFGNENWGVANGELPESTSGEWRVESGEGKTVRSTEYGVRSGMARGTGDESLGQPSAFGLQHSSPNEPLIPDLSIHDSPFSIQHSFVGGAVFSYVVAALILGTALAIAWAWKLPNHMQVAQRPAARPSSLDARPSTRMDFVGRITGMVDCQWSDPNTAVPGPVAVPLGRKYALSAGLLEITYDTGAKVILQGPCTYEVASKDGGYLSVGTLTAKVENKEERRTKNEELSASRSSFLIPHSYFAVRTPTATITDLGTEFGVVVEPSGATEAHVFQGKVEARLLGGNGDASGALLLEAKQSARIDLVQGQAPAIRLTAIDTDAFARKMPRRVPVPMFSTGVGLQPSEADPHWQIVAVSIDPGFQPRGAVVAAAQPGGWLDNDALQSQWLSIEAGTGAVNGAVYTFRTGFDLTDVQPETAILHGRFVVDNHVLAIRLNGHDVSVPEHAYDGSYSRFERLTIAAGFVAGNNILEFDVENGTPGCKESDSPLGLRVELEATAHGRQ